MPTTCRNLPQGNNAERLQRTHPVQLLQLQAHTHLPASSALPVHQHQQPQSFHSHVQPMPTTSVPNEDSLTACWYAARAMSRAVSAAAARQHAAGGSQRQRCSKQAEEKRNCSRYASSSTLFQSRREHASWTPHYHAKALEPMHALPPAPQQQPPARIPCHLAPSTHLSWHTSLATCPAHP